LGVDTQDHDLEEQNMGDNQLEKEKRGSSNVYIGQWDTIKEKMVWNLMEKGQEFVQPVSGNTCNKDKSPTSLWPHGNKTGVKQGVVNGEAMEEFMSRGVPRTLIPGSTSTRKGKMISRCSKSRELIEEVEAKSVQSRLKVRKQTLVDEEEGIKRVRTKELCEMDGILDKAVAVSQPRRSI
jgi:hypothetical protein